MFTICFLFTFKHQDYRVLFCKVAPETIFNAFLHVFDILLLLIKYTNYRILCKEINNETIKNITLETLNFKLTQFLLCWKRTCSLGLVCTLRQYYLICLYIKWYILCFKLLFCTTLKSNRGENLNRIYMYVDSTNRLGTFAKLSYPGSGRQTFCR